MRNFLHQWMREWLPGLTGGKKWNRTHKDISDGDIVLVIEPNLPKGHWQLGRVLEIHTGKDGYAVCQSESRTEITKLSPLEISDLTKLFQTLLSKMTIKLAHLKKSYIR